MRILKRNLAFMLALVMALGLMTTASAANVKDYKDANDVTYVEAVDVLTALKVLDGTDGSFNPTDTLTREQGAKIIAYLMLGADAAKALSTSVAPFVDVAANRWSAGFVAYCVSQNIIGGYGDGNFGPEDTLTANQFAKMLLCAVGYNANGEFTGSNWEIEVSKTALTEGVFDDNLGANFSAGVSREEAALYAFNTLTSVMTVTYSDVFGTYYSGKLFNNSEEFNNEYTLGYKLYNLTSKDSTDDFQRACHYWLKKSTKLTGNYHDDADATYTAKVKSGTLYTDLGLTENTKATVYKNGVKQSDYAIEKNLTNSDYGIGGNGILVEAYVDEDENVTLILVETYLAQVTSVDEDDDEVTVSVYQTGLTITDDTFETAVEYEEDDYVLVTVAAGEIQSIKAAGSETGKITVYGSSYVTLDGTKYNHSAKIQKSNTDVYPASDAYDYDSEMKVLLDEYGYAIGVVIEDEAEASYDYVLVTDSETKAGSLISSKANVVEVMYLDGKTEVLPLSTKTVEDKLCYRLDNDWAPIVDANSDTKIDDINGFYRYTMTDDGKIVLKSIVSGTDTKALWDYDTVSATKGNNKLTINGSVVTDKFMNASTVYSLVTEDAVKTTTSYKNISIDTDGSDVYVLVLFTNKVINKVYVMDVEGEVAENDIYAYYNGTTFNASSGKKMTLFMGGESVSYGCDGVKLYNEETSAFDITVTDFTSDGPLAKGAYIVEIVDGEVSTMKLVSSTSKEVTSAQELYFKTGSTNNDYNYYADEVKIYDITDGGAEATVARNDYVVWVEDGEGFVSYVYIVAATDSTKPESTDPTTPDYETSYARGTDAAANTFTFKVENVADADMENVTVVIRKFVSGAQYGQYGAPIELSGVEDSGIVTGTFELTADGLYTFQYFVGTQVIYTTTDLNLEVQP